MFGIRYPLLLFAVVPLASASILCVNPRGSNSCYTSIQAAVNAAGNYDVIQVAAGTYKETVVIGKPLSLLGSGAELSVIDATNLPHGIFVDGWDHPGLQDVTIAGFTIRNALYEGILVVNASDVTIRDNHILNNDLSPGLSFTGAAIGCPGQPGNGIYENDETGDCGGGLHLVGTAHSIISENLIAGNADGILISDETAESHDNLVIHNTVRDNPLECGIVLASHPTSGSPPFGPHHGVNHNTISENISTHNGVSIGGSGVGLFSDGKGPGRVSGNVIIRNELTGNGLGGVALHTHVGPAFHLPPDDMDGNMIIGNYIADNLADLDDTATPGTVGININSGGGGTPVHGTIISGNVIRDEQVDVAINTPADVNVHLNNLLGGNIGVANVCAFDHASCAGTIDATENYWGCPVGPGNGNCSSTSGANIRFTPWLEVPISNESTTH
jgi:parallel beta-helix repeat protein